MLLVQACVCLCLLWPSVCEVCEVCLWKPWWSASGRLPRTSHMLPPPPSAAHCPLFLHTLSVATFESILQECPFSILKFGPLSAGSAACQAAVAQAYTECPGDSYYAYAFYSQCPSDPLNAPPGEIPVCCRFCSVAFRDQGRTCVVCECVRFL